MYVICMFYVRYMYAICMLYVCYMHVYSILLKATQYLSIFMYLYGTRQNYLRCFYWHTISACASAFFFQWTRINAFAYALYMIICVCSVDWRVYLCIHTCACFGFVMHLFQWNKYSWLAIRFRTARSVVTVTGGAPWLQRHVSDELTQVSWEVLIC